MADIRRAADNSGDAQGGEDHGQLIAIRLQIDDAAIGYGRQWIAKVPDDYTIGMWIPKIDHFPPLSSASAKVRPTTLLLDFNSVAISRRL